MGFAKLDSGIVDSSVWSEPLATRVVWITMLAKANHLGFVSASESGLLRACNVEEKDFKEAIKALESPDSDSRTPDFDGRRIEKVQGGWSILNYLKYRQFSYSENPESVRKREYRRDNLGHVPKSTGHSASASMSASDDQKEEGCKGETKTWRNDFSIYQAEARSALNDLLNDNEWRASRETFHPNLNISLSLQKAWGDYWTTEAAWKNKKSKKTKDIDWKATANNALSQKCNQVWRSNSSDQKKFGYNPSGIFNRTLTRDLNESAN